MINDVSKPATVMVVNDDRIQLEVLAGLLRKAGLETRTFTGAEAALTALAGGTLPNLIVTDLFMPGIDGWRFCRLLRSSEYAAYNAIPILVVSATFAGDEASRIAAELGAEAFLPSPVDGKRFCQQVQAILGGQTLRTPLRVLIVEDNAMFGDLLTVVFANHGYQSETARTCREATDALGQTAFDVAVVDYHLPDGAGDALLDALRAKQPDCVCLMMTSDPGPELALDWMKRGAAAYLQKPFKPDYLIEMCAKARRERALLRVEDLLEVRTRELRESEERKAKLETQFQHAQKMESVGRLAGGVAHDFNNMLQAILGNVFLAMEATPPGTPLRENLEEIQKVARHSADLTQQLLAFARQQPIAPKVLDLNKTVESLLKLLRRLIGEDIHLTWMPATGLEPVKMDPTQIDQILANLCVNARDAIGGVGKITIETQRAPCDEAYCAEHPDVAPGDYVRLSVRDDGCGMDKVTMAHIFEPFFTTKGVGVGTGLGLATVYGIVKQNQGFIQVDSEPGKGTTIHIHLPQHQGALAATPAESAPAPARTERASALPRSAGETLLLVEDEPAILTMAHRMLAGLGYTLLTANTPGEALRLAAAPTTDIHLLITDVVMPEMNGGELARRLLLRSPDLKCLFMSGYTADVIAHRGVLEEGVHFLQKPFSMEELATKVREAMGGRK
jgi:CheY-like chemotaxis protein